MGFLGRGPLFLVFLVVTLVDATTLVREWLLRERVGLALAVVAVGLDAWILWRLARATEGMGRSRARAGGEGPGHP